VICPHDGTILVPADKDPLIGESLGNYKVTGRLGIGGMGAVYAAFETNIEKKVAIKIVHPHLTNHPDLPTLLAEARAANAIGDRGIVDIHGFGAMPDGRQYLVMEMLEGESLEHRLSAQKQLPLEEILSIAEPIASSLEAAHAAGFVHRDIKSANVFIVRPPTGAPFTKLLDFGLAQRARVENTVALGTPGYVAPEQAQAGAVGPAADLYSLGCLIFEMAAGQLPFDDPDPANVLGIQLSAPRPHLRAKRPEMPEALDALVFKLMQIDPAARPASASVVLQALRAMAPKSKSRARWLFAAAVVVAAGIAAAVALQPTPMVAPQDDPVEQAVARAADGVALDAGLDGAADRLLAAEKSFPGRREWTALRGELARRLRGAATEALARNDLDAARSFANELERVDVADAGPDALEQELSRGEFARRHGMVRVEGVVIDAFEYPNRAGAAPETGIDWPDAVKLCEQAGKHLCTEDEWQRACRGAAGRDFPYGATLDKAKCVGKQPKVKSPLASGALGGCVTAEGVHELSGNVAEWTATAVHEGKPQRVIRGGSFAQSDTQLSCTARDYFLPGLGGAKHIGFRCCY
jgi:hypothetical protein